MSTSSFPNETGWAMTYNYLSSKIERSVRVYIQEKVRASKETVSENQSFQPKSEVYKVNPIHQHSS